MVDIAKALEKIDNRIRIQEDHLLTMQALARRGNGHARGGVPYLADEIRWLNWMRRDLHDEDH